MNVDEEEEPAVFENAWCQTSKTQRRVATANRTKRLELWKQKHEKGDVPLVENESEVTEPDEKDILDDEEEEDFEMTESEDSDDDNDEGEMEQDENNLPFLDEEVKY